tara:strand:- start:301 stop:609 length:309 start_codon:yes stop_codon:yes gene_type:complete
MYAKIAKRHDKKDSGEKHFYYEQKHAKKFTSDLKKMIKSINRKKLNYQKLTETLKLFEYLVKNKWYLKLNPVFQESVYDKLFDIYKYKNFEKHSVKFLALLH